ncbi:MAG: hypothetical protein COA91_13900 [Robiginitomaculum sp.]|nr:MAG: hypothetical protein COA91_13900 [Robiginitomaculum sp.]
MKAPEETKVETKTVEPKISTPESIPTPPAIAEDFTSAAEPYIERGSSDGEFIAPETGNDNGRSR